MTIPFSTSNAAGFNFSDIFVVQTSGYAENAIQVPLALGTTAVGSDGSQWIYVKFGTGGQTGLGSVCVFDEDFLAVMMSNSVGGLGDKIGVGTAAALVDNYGWLQVYGTCDAISVAASCAANVALASTSSGTPGVLDDATGTGTKNISGIILTTAATTAGTYPGTLNFPVIGSTN